MCKSPAKHNLLKSEGQVKMSLSTSTPSGDVLTLPSDDYHKIEWQWLQWNTCNPSTRDTEAGGSNVLGQHGLYSDTLSTQKRQCDKWSPITGANESTRVNPLLLYCWFSTQNESLGSSISLDVFIFVFSWNIREMIIILQHFSLKILKQCISDAFLHRMI